MKKARLIAVVLCMIIFTVNRPVLAGPTDLSLDEAVAMALKNNADVKIARISREQSIWAVRQAEAGKGFTLSYTHSAERYNTPPSYLNNYRYTWTTKYDNELSLSLPVYSGGKLEGQIDKAKLNFEVAELSVTGTEQQTKQSVTTYYFSVLQTGNALNISRDTVANYASHLKNVQSQYDVGIVAKSDVLASEVSLANAQNSLIKAENSYQLAVSTLNNAIGLPLDRELKLKDDLQYEQYTPTLAECASHALANRPEIAEYQANIAIAGDDLKIAQSGYLPKVNLTASQDWYDKELPGANNNNWYVALTVSLNLLDSGLTHSQVKQAKAGIDAAREQARQKRDNILLEVRQYYLGMREAEKRIDTSKVAGEQATENLRIAELRYSAGVGTNLDVLDAVLALNTARNNIVQALYDYNTNRAQLFRAMGVAVEDSPPAKGDK